MFCLYYVVLIWFVPSTKHILQLEEPFVELFPILTVGDVAGASNNLKIGKNF